MTKENKYFISAVTDYIKAQKSMGKALKNATNPHFKNRYADLGNVLDACLSAFQNNNFLFIQPNNRDEHGDYVETKIIHDTGVEFVSKVYLVIDKQTMQGLGSAITYARRYGALQMAGLAPEDDDGNDASREPRRVLPIKQNKNIIREDF
tara:strand:- start:2885 stop:3334 length:450 start_codon:yes stop_codon:yes gene_type:complete